MNKLPDSLSREQFAEVWTRLAGFLSTRSESTRLSYMGILREYVEFLGHQIGSVQGAQAILSAQPIHAQGYLQWLKGQPGQPSRYYDHETDTAPVAYVSMTENDGTRSTQSNRTIAKKASVLRRLYRVLQGSGLLPSINPFDGDVTPAPSAESGQKRPTEMVPFEYVLKVVDAPVEADMDEIKAIRDRAILAALFGAGLRRSEAARLRMGDIKQSKDGSLYLRLRATKGKQDASQALPRWSEERFREWFDYRKGQGAKGAAFVFTTFTGRGGVIQIEKGVSVSAIFRLFKHYAKLAGVEDHVTPHSARATAITRLLDAGLTHRDVQDFSRHKSVAMVETYDKRRRSVEESPAKLLEF